MTYQVTGIEKMRKIVNMFNNCREDWNSQFTEAELLKIGQYHFDYVSKEWDIYPDSWTPPQIEMCLSRGRVPQFGIDESGRMFAKLSISVGLWTKRNGKGTK